MVTSKRSGVGSESQRDLAGKRLETGVTAEEKMSTTFTFWAGHFYLRISASALNTVQQIDDPGKRRYKLSRKVKARPDAEVIPEGAKKTEMERLIAVALAANPRGKFD